MRFEWMVALRYLRDGRFQTLLILSGIGVGVGVIIFLSALINGLQASLIARTLGTQPHIIVRPPEDVVRPLMREPNAVFARRMEKPPQRMRSILQWQQKLRLIENEPEVTAVAPIVAGPGFAVRGLANTPVAIRGVNPVSFEQVIDIRRSIVEGEFRVDGSNAVVGTELASTFGISTGDKIRLETPMGNTDVFSVAGIFDVGNKDLNERWVFVSLSTAQTLFDLRGGISTFEIKVKKIFDAEKVAESIANRTGLVADSWMKLNRQLLVGLRSQSSSSYMIQTFVIIAVALGIASVLVVSVVQRSREIGILKAMGTPSGRIIRVFLVEGAILGFVGSILGVLLGVALSLFFASLARNPDGSPTFPVDLNLFLYLRSAAIATTVGIVSAIAPARRAAKLDPAEVIRYG